MGLSPRPPDLGPDHASTRCPDLETIVLTELADLTPGSEERLPGRAEPADPSALAALLRETAEHHYRFEKAAPAHDWWDWYAAYLRAREQGSNPDQADAAADRYMAEVKDVVVSTP